VPEPEFDDIVARLRADDRRRRTSRLLLAAGLVACLAAGLMVTFGGVRGIVLAVFPWLLGVFLVIRSVNRSG